MSAICGCGHTKEISHNKNGCMFCGCSAAWLLVAEDREWMDISLGDPGSDPSNVDLPTLAAHQSSGKPQVGDLDPAFIIEMGEVMTKGLVKYPNDPDGMPNWWKGGKYRGFCASIIRHAMALAMGEDDDAEDGLPHAAHLAVDAMFLRSWQVRGVGVDNRLKNFLGGQE